MLSILPQIHQELTGIFSRVNPAEVDALLDAIERAGTVALHGVGREGLMMRAFAMRLYHLGYAVSVVGDMTAPHLGPGDLLILSAGPGYFATVDALRTVAQRDGATVFCLTAQASGRVPQACDGRVTLPAQTMADDFVAASKSTLTMGSVYELAMFVFSEGIILELLKRTGKTIGEARDRHTNLE